MIFVMKQPILYTDTANQRKAGDRKKNICDEVADCGGMPAKFNLFIQSSNHAAVKKQLIEKIIFVMRRQSV